MLGMAITHFGASIPSYRTSTSVSFWDGRAMPVFMVLAGAGFTLLASSVDSPLRVALGRASVLLVLGLWMEGQVNAYVILQFYAVFLVASMLVRRTRTRTLVAAACITALAGGLVRIYIAADLPQPRYASEPSLGLGMLSSLLHPIRLGSTLLFTGEYPFFPSFAFVLAGMILARALRRDPAIGRHLAVAGLAVMTLSVAIGAAAREYKHPAVGYRIDSETKREVPTQAGLQRLGAIPGETAQTWLNRHPYAKKDPHFFSRNTRVSEAGWKSSWRLLRTTQHSQMLGWVASTIGFAVSLIGLCILVTSRLPALTRPLAIAGQLALTFYVSHLFFYHVPGFRDALPSPGGGALRGIALWLGFIPLAFVWRTFARRGPLEMIVRAAGNLAASSSAGLRRERA